MAGVRPGCLSGPLSQPKLSLLEAVRVAVRGAPNGKACLCFRWQKGPGGAGPRGPPGPPGARSSAAIAEARRLGHPPSLAVSLSMGARLLSLFGENAALDERANQLVGVSTEQGFPHWRAEGTIFRGWVKVKNRDVAEGISLLCSGSAAYRATGAEMWMPQYTALLARACEIAGRIEEGLTLMDEALQIGERTGERWLEAELTRHKASCCCGKVIPRPPRSCIAKP